MQEDLFLACPLVNDFFPSRLLVLLDFVFAIFIAVVSMFLMSGRISDFQSISRNLLGCNSGKMVLCFPWNFKKAGSHVLLGVWLETDDFFLYCGKKHVFCSVYVVFHISKLHCSKC